jgi:hypothetical protein
MMGSFSLLPFMVPSRLAFTLLTAASVGLISAPWQPLQAGGRQPAFPTNAQLREVQLATFACSRENSAAECARARQLADPLMDNPLLPSFCKDVVWDIIQKAQPVAVNSYSRRDALDRAAEQVSRNCREILKPPVPQNPPGGSPAGSGPGSGGGGFGILGPRPK